MAVYYALIMLSVCLFGGCFSLGDVYRRIQGSSLRVSMQFSLAGSLAGLAVLTAVNGFKVECTPFTLLMAVLTAVNGFAFTFCSFRALEHINLSLYSLFSMLGGMLLPFLQGILFYGEPLTVAKAVCLVLITASLALTVEKGERKNGAVYYSGIFVLNGMSGVLSKWFAEADFPKTGATGYTNLTSLCSVVIAAVLLLTVFRKSAADPPLSLAGAAMGAVHGVLNRAANLVLVIALTHVDASVQYPLVTGGVMIVSTLLCFFTENKPSRREIVSVFVAFIGLLLLFAIPI